MSEHRSRTDGTDASLLAAASDRTTPGDIAPTTAPGAPADWAGVLQVLDERIVPELVSRAPADRAVRVWVPACGTGEEAYAVAALFADRVSASGGPGRWQMFATDADERVIEAARHGGDPGRRALRDAIFFGPQDVRRDAPFSSIDLVICRHVLSGLDAGARRAVLARLHFALRDSGYLCVEPSDRVDAVGRLFAPVDAAAGIYRRLRPFPPREEDARSPLGTPVAVQRLERELGVTRETLQEAIEEMEAANEELQAANAELETSREELRLLNQELIAVNARLQEKILALDRSTSDMANLLANSDVSMLFLSGDLRIMRFTPAIKSLLHLREGDVGRPLRDLALRIDDEGLEEDCRRVFAELGATEKTVRADDGRLYLRRIRPYHTADESVGGVVVSLVDVTEERRLERRLSAARIAERQRVARELHDELGGELTGIGMLANNLRQECEAASLPHTAALGDIVRRVRGAQEQVRRIARGLEPVVDLPEGLLVALGRLAEQYTRGSGVRCRVVSTPPVDVGDPTRATQLYHIAQEAVLNAVTHGQPTEVVIELAQSDGALVLRVSNDGPGFDQVQAASGPGLGLSSVRQRCRELGGELEIRTGHGSGGRSSPVACRRAGNPCHRCSSSCSAWW